MDTPLNNFNKLCNSIRKAAAQDLNKNYPKIQLAEWQKLLTVIWETELAMHRLRSALNLLKTLPPKETLNMFSMSEGAWIDYQYATWLFWMFSLLEREKSLVSRVVRNLVKPSNPQYKDIEKTLLKSVETQRNAVKKVRHPEAHVGEGGATEAVIKTDLWKNFLIIPTPVDFNEILASYVPFHMRWYNFLHGASIVALAEMERVCGELIKHINWDKI